MIITKKEVCSLWNKFLHRTYLTPFHCFNSNRVVKCVRYDSFSSSTTSLNRTVEICEQHVCSIEELKRCLFIERVSEYTFKKIVHKAKIDSKNDSNVTIEDMLLVLVVFNKNYPYFKDEYPEEFYHNICVNILSSIKLKIHYLYTSKMVIYTMNILTNLKLVDNIILDSYMNKCSYFILNEEYEIYDLVHFISIFSNIHIMKQESKFKKLKPFNWSLIKTICDKLTYNFDHLFMLYKDNTYSYKLRKEIKERMKMIRSDLSNKALNKLRNEASEDKNHCTHGSPSVGSSEPGKQSLFNISSGNSSRFGCSSMFEDESPHTLKTLLLISKSLRDLKYVHVSLLNEVMNKLKKDLLHTNEPYINISTHVTNKIFYIMQCFLFLQLEYHMFYKSILNVFQNHLKRLNNLVVFFFLLAKNKLFPSKTIHIFDSIFIEKVNNGLYDSTELITLLEAYAMHKYRETTVINCILFYLIPQNGALKRGDEELHVHIRKNNMCGHFSHCRDREADADRVVGGGGYHNTMQNADLYDHYEKGGSPRKGNNMDSLDCIMDDTTEIKSGKKIYSSGNITDGDTHTCSINDNFKDRLNGTSGISDIGSIGRIDDIGDIGSIGRIDDIGDIGSIGRIDDIGDIGSIGRIDDIGDIGSIGRIDGIGKIESNQGAGLTNPSSSGHAHICSKQYAPLDLSESIRVLYSLFKLDIYEEKLTSQICNSLNDQTIHVISYKLLIKLLLCLCYFSIDNVNIYNLMLKNLIKYDIILDSIYLTQLQICELALRTQHVPNVYHKLDIECKEYINCIRNKIKEIEYHIKSDLQENVKQILLTFNLCAEEEVPIGPYNVDFVEEDKAVFYFAKDYISTTTEKKKKKNCSSSTPGYTYDKNCPSQNLKSEGNPQRGSTPVNQTGSTTLGQTRESYMPQNGEQLRMDRESSSTHPKGVHNRQQIEENKIIIEVDGEHHFYKNTKSYTSFSKLKHKLLNDLGYTVVNIPYFVWALLKTDLHKKAYIKKLLSDKTNFHLRQILSLNQSNEPLNKSQVSQINQTVQQSKSKTNFLIEIAKYRKKNKLKFLKKKIKNV
ncbi:RAP protein, putative [Plasmodium malariae]|uniref:RAP protein, putative n=1 Tax=Plasmodium malariae TaxID=5858 RepID=A0A1C3KZB9_PLAMA|nr:RAP protein, putative [Plasmodium malariae]